MQVATVAMLSALSGLDVASFEMTSLAICMVLYEATGYYSMRHSYTTPDILNIYVAVVSSCHIKCPDYIHWLCLSLTAKALQHLQPLIGRQAAEVFAHTQDTQGPLTDANHHEHPLMLQQYLLQPMFLWEVQQPRVWPSKYSHACPLHTVHFVTVVHHRLDLYAVCLQFRLQHDESVTTNTLTFVSRSALGLLLTNMADTFYSGKY